MKVPRPFRRQTTSQLPKVDEAVNSTSLSLADQRQGSSGKTNPGSWEPLQDECEILTKSVPLGRCAAGSEGIHTPLTPANGPVDSGETRCLVGMETILSFFSRSKQFSCFLVPGTCRVACHLPSLICEDLQGGDHFCFASPEIPGVCWINE